MGEFKPAADVVDSDTTRIPVEVVTTTGHAEQVALRVQTDTVEIWCRAQCCGVFDRNTLRSWLTDGHRRLTSDQVTLSVDPRSDGERVAISLPDVIAWTISPTELAAVRKLV